MKRLPLLLLVVLAGMLSAACCRPWFKPLDTEWWHFTLQEEPYTDTYFNYPVRQIKTCRQAEDH